MTPVLIDVEIVKALGLSIAFVGVMLSIISVGISFIMYRLSKKKAKQYLKMAGLITAWAIFMFLNTLKLKAAEIFLKYSLIDIINLSLGIVILLVFLFMLPKFLKYFDKKMLIIAGIIAFLVVLMEIIFPFYETEYLELLTKILIIIPPLMGFFMIIKSYIEGKND